MGFEPSWKREDPDQDGIFRKHQFAAQPKESFQDGRFGVGVKVGHPARSCASGTRVQDPCIPILRFQTPRHGRTLPSAHHFGSHSRRRGSLTRQNVLVVVGHGVYGRFAGEGESEVGSAFADAEKGRREAGQLGQFGGEAWLGRLMLFWLSWSFWE